MQTPLTVREVDCYHVLIMWFPMVWWRRLLWTMKIPPFQIFLATVGLRMPDWKGMPWCDPAKLFRCSSYYAWWQWRGHYNAQPSVRRLEAYLCSPALPLHRRLFGHLWQPLPNIFGSCWCFPRDLRSAWVAKCCLSKQWRKPMPLRQCVME